MNPEYVRGLEDAAKVVESSPSAYRKEIAARIRALKAAQAAQNAAPQELAEVSPRQVPTPAAAAPGGVVVPRELLLRLRNLARYSLDVPSEEENCRQVEEEVMAIFARG